MHGHGVRRTALPSSASQLSGRVGADRKYLIRPAMLARSASCAQGHRLAKMAGKPGKGTPEQWVGPVTINPGREATAHVFISKHRSRHGMRTSWGSPAPKGCDPWERRVRLLKCCDPSRVGPGPARRDARVVSCCPQWNYRQPPHVATAGDEGNAVAQHTSATFYLLGEGVQQDQRRRWSCFAGREQAMQRQFNPGYCTTGQGVAQGYAAAVSW